MRPTDVSRFVIDGLDSSRKIKIVVTPGKSFGFSLRGQVIDAVTLRGHHVEKTGRRIETGRKPIRGATGAGRDQSAITRWLFLRIGNGLALRIDSQRPIAVNEGRRQQMLTVAAVE